MTEPTSAQKPLDLAVLMAFGVRLHLFTRQKGEEVRARLRGRLGKAHTSLAIAEWLEISPGELDQLIRAVRKLPRDCTDAELVAAFRRKPTEDGLLAVGGAPPPPPAVPAASVSIGRDVFSDPALPALRDPVLSPRRFEWGRAVDLWTRMGLITPEVASDLLDRIGAQEIDALTPAALAGWLGVHEATLERMLRLAKTLPDDVTPQAAREAFQRAQQADPHDLGTIEFGVNTPSSSFLKPFVPPAVPPTVPRMRPSEEETKIVSSPPPAGPPLTATLARSFGPYVLPGGFGLEGGGEAAAIEALSRRLLETGGVAPDADATALARRLFERWARDLAGGVLAELRHELVPRAVVRSAGVPEGEAPLRADDVLLEYDGARVSTSYSYCAAKDAAVRAGKAEVEVVVRRQGEEVRLRVNPSTLQLQLAIQLELRPQSDGEAASRAAS